MELTEDILKQLMDLVFRLVCNGELSLARVLSKNILDKVEKKKLLRYTNSLKPPAARGVSARYGGGGGGSGFHPPPVPLCRGLPPRAGVGAGRPGFGG